MNLLIEGGTVITMSSRGTIHDGAIVIENGRVSEVDKAERVKPKYRRYERINAENQIIIPGLINTHHHAAMSILRGYADDLNLKAWLENWIWPIEQHMTGQDMYVGALLTAIESIMGGTTTVNTMYHYTDEYNEARAFAEAGLRGVVGHVCFSWRKDHDKRALESLAKTWHNKKEGLMRVSIDPHAPYTVDPDYMRELKELGDKLEEKYGSSTAPIIWHMHIAETADEFEKTRQAFKVTTKAGLVEYLDRLNVLSENVVAAHCVHLTEREIEILATKNVKASHNPVSNLKLASGVAPVPQLLEKGVTVSLGTDSSCSNNSSDMFEVMKIAALLHKGVSGDPTVLPAGRVLSMATIAGAKALQWDNELGSIEPGKRADLALIDFRKPHLTPLYDETSHLVYATKNADVDTVIINGELVMEHRKIKTVDTHWIMRQAERAKNRLLERVG